MLQRNDNCVSAADASACMRVCAKSALVTRPTFHLVSMFSAKLLFEFEEQKWLYFYILGLLNP